MQTRFVHLSAAAFLLLAACSKHKEEKGGSTEGTGKKEGSGTGTASGSETGTGTGGGGGGGGLVNVDGSSTVYLIAQAVAEDFQKAGKGDVTVASSGTGGGFK